MLSWSQNERQGQIVRLLQHLIEVAGGSSDDYVCGQDVGAPTLEWLNDVALLDAYQAESMRKRRKKTKKQVADEAWRNKRYEDVV